MDKKQWRWQWSLSNSRDAYFIIFLKYQWSRKPCIGLGETESYSMHIISGLFLQKDSEHLKCASPQEQGMNLCGHKRQLVIGLQLSERSLSWISAHSPFSLRSFVQCADCTTFQRDPAHRAACLSADSVHSWRKQNLISWNHLIEKGHKN